MSASPPLASPLLPVVLLSLLPQPVATAAMAKRARAANRAMSRELAIQVEPPIRDCREGSRNYPFTRPLRKAGEPKAIAILFEVRDLDGARRATQQALRRAIRQRRRVDRQH